MANISQVFRMLMTRIKPSKNETAPALPASVVAEHMRLLLSCGF